MVVRRPNVRVHVGWCFKSNMFLHGHVEIDFLWKHLAVDARNPAITTWDV